VGVANAMKMAVFLCVYAMNWISHFSFRH